MGQMAVLYLHISDAIRWRSSLAVHPQGNSTFPRERVINLASGEHPRLVASASQEGRVVKDKCVCQGLTSLEIVDSGYTQDCWRSCCELNRYPKRYHTCPPKVCQETIQIVTLLPPCGRTLGLSKSSLLGKKKKSSLLGSPGGSVIKNPPANAGDIGSIPGLGRSNTPRLS